MQGTRAVQVELGEGEPGLLRLVLEAQGFDVVAHARGDDELRQVIGLTRPTVIVLDAGISALAVRDAQIRSDYTPIVVVWPKDAFTPVAEERVDPATAFLELGNAVRRVVERHAAPVRIPEAEDELQPLERMDADPLTDDLPQRRRRPGRRRHLLVVAAAWTVALTALGAIGLALPAALRGLEPAGSLHPVLDRPERALTSDREAPDIRPAGVGPEQGCSARPEVPNGPPGRRGRPDDPGRGCGVGRGTSEPPAPEHGHGGGRPDDPGRGSGRGSHGDRGGDKPATAKGSEQGDGNGADGNGGGAEEPQGKDGGQEPGGDGSSDEPAGKSDREAAPAGDDRPSEEDD